jgi:hypothetical protein
MDVSFPRAFPENGPGFPSHRDADSSILSPPACPVDPLARSPGQKKTRRWLRPNVEIAAASG